MTAESAKSLQPAVSDAMRHAHAFALTPAQVELLMYADPDEPTLAEQQFAQAFANGLATIPRPERAGSLNATTGHIAESLAATLLDDEGWTIVEQFIAPMSGGHGIDLAALSPDMDRLFIVEVKGTLSTTWPRLSRGETDQFTREWLDKPDNPGMSAWGLGADDVSGLVIFLQLARREWKAALTADFASATLSPGSARSATRRRTDPELTETAKAGQVSLTGLALMGLTPVSRARGGS